MQLVRFFVFAVLLLAVVKSEGYWGEIENSINYSNLPTTQLGTFEGTYTSTGGIGYYTNICQNGNTIFGAYDQLGIFNGNISSNTANGTWYEAGNDPCNTGSFQITLNSEGFTGWYMCVGNSTKYNWTETKLSPFRPTDDGCAIMDLTSSATLSGRFQDSLGLVKDFCNNKTNATISYLYADQNQQIIKAYFEGVSFLQGKIFLGTWYSLTPLAGADLYYLDNEGAIRSYYWTGLNGTNTTIIDRGQYYQPQYHNIRYYSGPIGTTSTANCSDYSTIKTKVLNNLVRDNDDDLYYFLSSDFNYRNDDDGLHDDDGQVDDDFISSDASHVYWFFLPVVLAFFL